MRNKYWLLIIISIITLNIENSFAALKTIEESCEYVMGDNDTKLDAKRLCLIEGKRKILERVGTYIESSTTVLNYNLTKDEIKTYAAGLIKTDIISEQTTFNGQNTVMHMKIRADVDTSLLEAKMIEIHKDKDLSAKYSKVAEEYKNLENQIRELQDKLRKNSDWASVEKARIEREDAFNKLSALEKIKEDIKIKTTLAVENVEIGMTCSEAVKLAGKPRSEGHWSFYSHLNYGNVWVICEYNIVTILVDVRCFQSHITRKDYFTSRNPCGAGQGIVKY